MTTKEITQIALAQSALEYGCAPEDFLCGENKVLPAGTYPKSRVYLEQPLFADFTSYGGNVVACAAAEIKGAVEDYLSRFLPAHCFETPNLYVLNEALRPFDHQICFMAEYFLPNTEALSQKSCPYSLRLLTPAQLTDLYLPQWSNALTEPRKETDRAAVGAFDGDTLIGLAGASADCEAMWQIGVDVLPGYRRQGIASALTSALAIHCLEQEKVPFYCCAWSNLPSVQNAFSSGFRPAWVQMTAKTTAFIAGMNG